MVFDDVAGEHHILVGHVDNRITAVLRTADVFDINATFAQIDRHTVVKGGRRYGQAGIRSSWPSTDWETLRIQLSTIFLNRALRHGAGGVDNDV